VPVYQLPVRPSTHDRAAEIAQRHAGRRKRGRPRSVSSTSNRSGSQGSQERQGSVVPTSTMAPSSAVKSLGNWMSTFTNRLRAIGSSGNSAPAVHTRLETEGALLRDSEDDEEEKLSASNVRHKANSISKHETQAEPIEKRGRGRPAFRPLDLPPTKPLRKPSSSSDDFKFAPARARPKQARMDQFMQQQPATTRPTLHASSLDKHQHPTNGTPKQQALESEA